MTFDAHISEHRFGYGPAPDVEPAHSVDDMLKRLAGQDTAQAALPLPPFQVVLDALALRRRFQSYARKQPDSEEGKAANQKSRAILKDIRQQHDGWFIQTMQRRISTNMPFRERLAAFWADHFTAYGKVNILRLSAPLYVEETVRPHIAGNFADMLIACVTHPLMLHFLDQNTSAGPNSIVARRRQGRRLGLNENLAREVLELHTLGVDGPYDQQDVQELAKLFTGLSATRNYGFKFRPRYAEPGPETVLEREYSARGGMDNIRALLTDLAQHPATARHIARKLAVHFIADIPNTDIVSSVESAYLNSGGELLPCYEALLSHPSSWSTPATNIRPPEEFIASALRVLGPTPDRLTALDSREIRRLFYRPLGLMGQPWMRPAGPDGFAEEDGSWVTPQGISARLEWAMNAPAQLLAELPDPRAFVQHALGGSVPVPVAFAAKAAEERAVAIGLILSSPAFQRR